MQLLDGKALSKVIKSELKEQVDVLIKEGKKPPHLVAVLVGENPASQSYVKSKVRACEQVGFRSTLIKKPVTTSQEELLILIRELNHDEDIDGFIVQLPLPKHIDEEAVLLAIDPNKDVDGFHPINFGRMAQGLDAYLPATPYGIITMLERYNIPTSGKHALVLGRSNIVGTPISILLSRKSPVGNCTVTLAHSHTQDVKSLALQADIIVAALGIPNFVSADMVKAGAVVIDVGINRIEDPSKKRGYRLVGDVDFEEVKKKASYITPVPGGVGLMTVVSLLKNTLKAAKGGII